MQLMNSTPSTLFGNQGLVSSHTAFQKPKSFVDYKISSQIASNMLKPNYNSTSFNKSDSVRGGLKVENSKLKGAEPVKKVKLEHQFSKPTRATEKKSNLLRSTKLTVEEVFNEPTHTLSSRTTGKYDFFDEEFVEGSSLSFISSISSLDDFEEGEKKSKIESANDYKVIEKLEEDNPESLVIKDHLLYSLESASLTNQVDLFSSRNYPGISSLKPFDNVHQPLELLQKIQAIQNYNKGEMFWNHTNMRSLYAGNYEFHYPSYNNFLQFPRLDLDQYITNQMLKESSKLALFNNYSDFQQGFEFSERNAANFQNSENILMSQTKSSFDEDGYDSDSNATKSTTFENENTNSSSGETLMGYKSQKSASPLYSISEKGLEEEKILETRIEVQKIFNPKGKERRGRPKKDTNLETEIKEKKKRSLNLNIDMNPQHLKVERRLNKLQLLRYQKDEKEGNNLLTLLGTQELNQNDTSNFLSNETQFSNILPVDPIANIPSFNLERSKRRTNLKPIWDPESLPQIEFSNYLNKLSEILETQVTNEEVALRLLKANGMNVLMALKVVSNNVLFHKEIFRIKSKRGRKRGI